MRKNDGRGRRTRAEERDEVEMLLRAAEDEAVLSLSVDAHHITASSETDYLPPDLHRRFQALKSSTAAAAASASASAASKTKPKAKAKVEEECEGDDLWGRFAALKASIPPQSHHRPVLELVDQPSAAGQEVIVDADITEEDQVAKVIQWAMDAARLDPSSPPPRNLPTTSSSSDISITTTSSSSESESESEGQSQSQDDEEDRTTADAAKRGAGAG